MTPQTRGLFCEVCREHTPRTFDGEWFQKVLFLAIGRPDGSIAIHPYEELVILERILQTPETTLAEIAEEVSQETGSSYHCSTLHHYLKRNGFTLKKLVKIAMQRREVARIDFRAITCHFPADMFVFVDESRFDKRIRRRNGYSLKGRRATCRRLHSSWGPRITANSIISTEALLDIGIYNGHVNGEIFLEFVSTILAPCLLPFNGTNKRSIVILDNAAIQDNAAIHHTQRAVDAINATGSLLIFFPAYSPDLMPCEELFSKAKHYIAQNDTSCGTFVTTQRHC